MITYQKGYGDNMSKIPFGKITFNVVGVTFEKRQGKLWNLRKAEYDPTKKVFLSLRREKNNERDKNAIAVIAHISDGKQPVFKIGYVPANIAVWLAPRMDNGLMVFAYAKSKNAKFVHGGNGHNLGVTLKVVYELLPSEVSKVTVSADKA